MKASTDKSLYLLLVTPVLIFFQLLVGFSIIHQIIELNQLREKQNKLETYLRNRVTYLINIETGLRGYLLTDNATYLEPYYAGLMDLQTNDSLANGLTNAGDMSVAMERLNELTRRKVALMKLKVMLSQQGLRDSALVLENSNTGKLAMDSIRHEVAGYLSQISTNVNHAENKIFGWAYLFVGIMIGMLLFHVLFSLYTYSRFRKFTTNILQLVDELNATNKNLRAYTQMSYHQLKEPLRNISGFVTLLQKRNAGTMDESSKEFIRHTVDAVHQMNDTIAQLRKDYLE